MKKNIFRRLKRYNVHIFGLCFSPRKLGKQESSKKLRIKNFIKKVKHLNIRKLGTTSHLVNWKKTKFWFVFKASRRGWETMCFAVGIPQLFNVASSDNATMHQRIKTSETSKNTYTICSSELKWILDTLFSGRWQAKHV